MTNEPRLTERQLSHIVAAMSWYAKAYARADYMRRSLGATEHEVSKMRKQARDRLLDLLRNI